MASNTDTLVTVFGGSGFLGRAVVRALCKRDYRIRVAVRRRSLQDTCSRSAGSARSTPCRPICAIRRPSRPPCAGPKSPSTSSASSPPRRAKLRAVHERAPGRWRGRRRGRCADGPCFGDRADANSPRAMPHQGGRRRACSRPCPPPRSCGPRRVRPEDDFTNRFAPGADFAGAALIGGG